MKPTEKNIKLISLDKIKPYKNNAKLHNDEQVGLLSRSLADFGFVGVMVLFPVGDEYEIVAGHGRYIAAKNNNIKEVWAEVRNDWDYKTAEAYRIADNTTVSDQYDINLLKTDYERLEGNHSVAPYMSSKLWQNMFNMYEDHIATEKEAEIKKIKFTVTCANIEAREQALQALFEIPGINVN